MNSRAHTHAHTQTHMHTHTHTQLWISFWDSGGTVISVAKFIKVVFDLLPKNTPYRAKITTSKSCFFWIITNLPRLLLNSDLIPICSTGFSYNTPLFLNTNLLQMNSGSYMNSMITLCTSWNLPQLQVW